MPKQLQALLFCQMQLHSFQICSPHCHTSLADIFSLFLVLAKSVSQKLPSTCRLASHASTHFNHSCTCCHTSGHVHALQLRQTYSSIRSNILAGKYQPVSTFACGGAAVTSYTAADLPTKSQFSEAAFAATQAAAGRLAALRTQVCQDHSLNHTAGFIV